MQASSTVEQPLFQLNDGKNSKWFDQKHTKLLQKVLWYSIRTRGHAIFTFLNIPDDIVRCDIDSIERHIISNTTIKSWTFTIIRREHTTKVVI